MPAPPLITRDNEAFYIEQHNRRADYIGPGAFQACRPRLTRFGSIPGIPPASTIIEKIPRDQWPALIAKGKGNWLHDRTKATLPVHDQNGLNWCWIYGSTRAIELNRFAEDHTSLLLSPDAAGWVITGGINRGGTGDEASAYLHKSGTCPATMWPANVYDHDAGQPGWRTAALEHKLLTWLDVDDYEMLVTCLLLGFPVALGLEWWGHLICAAQPELTADGKIAVGFDNSWGPSWGDNGYGLLDEAHAQPSYGAWACITSDAPTIDPIIDTTLRNAARGVIAALNELAQLSLFSPLNPIYQKGPKP